MKRITILLFLLFSITLGDGPLRKEYREFRTYPRLGRAYKLIETGEYDIAEVLLHEVLSIDSTKDEAHEALVNLYITQKRYRDAELHAAKLPSSSSAVHNYIQATTPKMPGAVDSSGRVTPPYSLITAYTRLNYAYSLIEMGYYKKAEPILLDLNHHFPEYPHPEEALVALYLATGDTGSAAFYFRELPEENEVRLRYEPVLGETSPSTSIGSIERKLTADEIRYYKLQSAYNHIHEKQYGEAEKVLKELYATYPEDETIGATLLSVLIEQKKYSDAEAYAQSFPLKSEPRTQYYQSAVYRALERHNFLDAYSYIDSMGGDQEEIKSWMARIARAEGYHFQNDDQPDVAEEAFRRSLYFNPDDTASREAIVLLLIEQDQLDEAFRFAVKLNETNHVRLLLTIARSTKYRNKNEIDSAWQLINSVPETVHNSEYYKTEKAYLFREKKEHDSSVVLFNQCRELSENLMYTREIAYSLQLAGKRSEATEEYKKAIEEAPDYAVQHDLSDSSVERDLLYLQRSNYYLNKWWDFTVALQPRLDHFDQPVTVVSPIEYASYAGYGSFEAVYSPPFMKRHLSLYSSSIVTMKDQSLSAKWTSLQTSIGVKVQPFLKLPVTASVQYSIGLGKDTRNVWLTRFAGSYSKGMDWEPVSIMRLFTNNYGEIAWLLGENTIYVTANGEIGPAMRVKRQQLAGSFVPYGTFGVAVNNDNVSHDVVTRVDAGVGVSFFMFNLYDQYKSYRMRNRFTFEMRRAIYTNGKDDSTFKLKWELNL